MRIVRILTVIGMNLAGAGKVESGTFRVFYFLQKAPENITRAV